MVVLKPEEVLKVADLARIAIQQEDISGYAESLSEILSLVEQMNEVDTSGVTPMAHPQEASQRLRVDEVKEADQRGHFQRIAPRTENGLYLVPKVIE